MRRRLMAGMLAATATLGISGVASAVNSADGVFFVHGTGDQTPPSSNHGFKPTDGSAVTSYWTTSALDAMTNSPDGTGHWSYGVAGYQGGTCDATQSCSWGVIADQIQDYWSAGNNGSIWKVVVVTHSNGSNPIRYMMAHPTAVTPKGTTVSTVLSHISRVIFIAGDNGGTPLADKVTTTGSLANIANDVVSLFGGGYNNNAVRQQVQSTIQNSYNATGVFASGTSPGGISTQYLFGSSVYAAIWSGDAWCAGYPQTVGLKAAMIYGWGSSSALTDGFIGSVTNGYSLGGTNVSSKMVGVNGMPGGNGDSRLNHNQSRRNCHGFASTVAANIHGAVGYGQTAANTFTATPTDYTISPAAQACDATSAYTFNLGNDSAGAAWSTNQYGCPASYLTDGGFHRDCWIAYGNSAGLVAPADYSNEIAYSTAANYTHSISAGGNSYGETTSSGCSDAWLGDGVCDFCLLAKYGYDSQSGSVADDDCVNAGAGSTNYCADMMPAYKNGTYQWDVYMDYSVSH